MQLIMSYRENTIPPGNTKFIVQCKTTMGPELPSSYFIFLHLSFKKTYYILVLVICRTHYSVNMSTKGTSNQNKTLNMLYTGRCYGSSFSYLLQNCN